MHVAKPVRDQSAKLDVDTDGVIAAEEGREVPKYTAKLRQSADSAVIRHERESCRIHEG